jgi:hypothetical protein
MRKTQQLWEDFRASAVKQREEKQLDTRLSPTERVNTSKYEIEDLLVGKRSYQIPGLARQNLRTPRNTRQGRFAARLAE